MALTLEPNTPQTLVIGQSLCFDGSAVLSIPQVDLQAVNLPSSGTNWTYSSLRFRKVSGAEGYDDCTVTFDPNIFGTRPFYFQAANDLFETVNYSMVFGIVDDNNRVYGYELYKYGGGYWFVNVIWANVFVYNRRVDFNEVFVINSTGTNLQFYRRTSGNPYNSLYAGTLPTTSTWRFIIEAANINNSLGYVEVFKGTYQGTIPFTWSAPLGGTLTGTATRQCFSAETSGTYQVCIDTEFDDPLCVDIEVDAIYFNPVDFECGGCVFTGDTVHFESNGGLDGTLTVRTITDDPLNIGTVIDALTWKAPDEAFLGAVLVYTLGEESIGCAVNVVPRFEVLNVEGDEIIGLVPGDTVQLLTNYDTLGGTVTWENLSCDNLVTPDGYLSIPQNFQNGCFGQIDCYIRARVTEFPGTTCPNLEPGGNQEYYQDFRILVDPVYPTPDFGGPNWNKWAPQVPDFRVISKTMEGGCSETHIRNRVPVQKWSINYQGLKYEDANPCAPPPCCDDPVGYLNGIDPKVKTAKVLDDFWRLTGGEYRYFTLIEPRTGVTWRKVRFDNRMERDHVNWHRNQSRTVSLVWNPCCATEPAGGVCPHSTVIKDIYPPSVPENPIVTPVSYSSLKVTWEKSVDNIGIQYYEILADGIIARGNSTPIYYDNGLEPLSLHTYQVRAVDFSGNISPWSSEVSGTTLAHDITPPAIPENFRGIPIQEAEFLTSGVDDLVSGSDFLVDSVTTGDGILLQWDAVTDPDIAGYMLVVDGYLIDVGNVLEYEDFPLEFCSEHQYYIRSYDTTGNLSPWSPELLAHTNCGEVDVVENGNQVVEGVDVVIDS